MSFEVLLGRSIDHAFATVFAAPPVECYARSGSYLTRLVFADADLANELLPFVLLAERGEPALQIGFLTSKDADLSDVILGPADCYRTVAGNEYFAMWQPGERPVLYLLDRESKRALIWFAADAVPDWIVSRPALPIMSAFSAGTDWVALHAAAVGRDGRILLLPGDERVGKTTAALSCALAGWDYAGDDFVFVNAYNGKVEPLYCGARLRADMAPAFSNIMTEAVCISSSDGEPRYELSLGSSKNGQYHIRGGKLAAILLPRRRGSSQPAFVRARRVDAIAGLKTSITMALSQLHPGARAEVAKKITTMVGLVPIFFVDTGKEPTSIPSAFARFLECL